MLLVKGLLTFPVGNREFIFLFFEALWTYDFNQLFIQWIV